MPNRIQRLPSSIKSAPKKEKQAAAQRVVDDILKRRGVQAEAEGGRKRVLAAYNTTRKCWQLEAQTAEDEDLCKTVLEEISECVRAEQASKQERKPGPPPAAEPAGESTIP
jgi:hypothetical protein